MTSLVRAASAALALCLVALPASAYAAGCAYDPAAKLPTTRDTGVVLPAAADAPCFAKGEAIEVGGETYHRFGAPIEVSEFEFAGWEQVAVWKDVPVFTELEGALEVMYLPADPKACSFQRYGLDKK